MSAPLVEASGAVLSRDPADAIRLRAIADANALRAIARSAVRDGLPKADLRATNARNAARKVLRHARQVSRLFESDVAHTPQAESRCSTIER